MTLIEEFREYQRLRAEGVALDEIFSMFRSPEENARRKLYKGYKPDRPDKERPDYKFKIVGGPLDGQEIEQMPRAWEMSFSGGWYKLSSVHPTKGKYYWNKVGSGGVSSGGAVGIASLNAFMPR